MREDVEARVGDESDWAARIVKTPAGSMWLVAKGDKLWAAEFEPRWSFLANRLLERGVEMREGASKKPNRLVLVEAAAALKAYFARNFKALKRIPLELEGSAMQKRVWSILGEIPPGETISYKELAKRARRAGAFRAIGAANGANPCAVFVPCHRVVGSSGDLQGYGGGLHVKARLLAHEGVHTDGWRVISRARATQPQL